MNKIIYSILLLLAPIATFAQSLEHPIIWTTKGEKQEILTKINRNEWASSVVDQLHEKIDATVEKHISNPSLVLRDIPKIEESYKTYSDADGVAPASAHNAVLRNATYASILYFLYGDEKYAQYGADVIMYYMNELSQRTPQTTSISGSGFFDPRTTYNNIALTYDFLYDYLNTSGRKVYDVAKGEYVDYDNDTAQRAITNIVGDALQEYGKPDVYGSMISNHPILTAPGVLYSILCVEDDTERERLLDVFWDKGTKHQSSFKRTILPMFGEQGSWPEALSYSFMPNVTMVLNILDKLKPEMNLALDYNYLFDGNFLFDNLRAPDRRFVRYGDSHRGVDLTETLYRISMDVATRHNFKELTQKAAVALQQKHQADGGFKPVVTNGTFDNITALVTLFLCEELPEVKEKIDFQKPTVIVNHAGVALQRNYVEKNNEEYGLCGIIGGGFYVHSQATGITMELYGSGYFMTSGGALPETLKERKEPLHMNYYVRHAGNNTMIVNGTTHGGTRKEWRRDGHLWQNTAVNIASEPKHLEDPINKNFSFATQRLDDEENKCEQERTLAILRTSETTAYYLDIFRSKSLVENKFHDYIYHNIGDRTVITDTKNKEFKYSLTDRFDNEIGDGVQSPGWCYYDSPAEVTKLTSAGVNVRYDVDFDKRYMHMIMPSGIEREYAKTLAPPIREAKNGYDKKKSQLLAIRQYGEAWDKPYVVVLESSKSKDSSVQSVANLMSDGVVVGAEITSKVGNKQIVDIVICQGCNDAKFEDSKRKIYFEGRYGVVRLIDGKVAELYIGDGKKLSMGECSIATNGERGAATKCF